jgi:hypothetical protein
MRASWKDGLATLLVFAAGLLYILWVTDSAFGAMTTRAVSVVVFALGFAACMSDVSRMTLAYGPRSAGRPPTAYLVTATLVGVVALVAALGAVIAGSAAMLVTLVVTTGLLWVMATTAHRRDLLVREHHTGLHRVA